MATPGEQVVRFQPRSVADTIAGDNSPPGACAALTNLIPDPSTPSCFICRPANLKIIDFTAWGAAPGTVGVVSVGYEVGSIIYGLVGITSGAFSGYDYPFAFDILTSAFLTVSGTITGKVPTSQATTGDWSPPQMALTGIDLVVSHIGFSGGNFFGWFDVTTPTSPSWNAGNTATNGLPSVPQAVQTFNNRTYFMCGNLAYYTDTLALNMTNSNQSLSIGDYTSVTAFAPLPLSTTSQGVIQGLLAFKLNSIYQITGDVATMNLGLNQISPSVGTAAPRTVVPTPEGVAFMAVDGIRIVNFFSELSEPNKDLAVPFIYAVTPSRACAGFNSDTYRICVENGAKVGSPFEDYWFHISRKTWTGPHSFNYDLALPYGNDFVLASNSRIASAWQSFVVQGHNNQGTTFVENGTALTWVYATAPMTDLGNIYANGNLRATVEIASPASGQVYNFIAQDESGTGLAVGQIMLTVAQTIWGVFIWGVSKWGATVTGLLPLTIPWNQAVVFNRLAITASGPSALGFKISSFNLAYKRLKYLLN
jgi:hypothetical protein